MSDLLSYMRQCRDEVERALMRWNPTRMTVPGTLVDAVTYSLTAGGKRVRPLLAIAATEALGGERSAVLPAACALEMIHTYSLIHDDLPAMDNDDFRRGKPTNHKVFGEANAILAGDALGTEAFALLSREGVTGLDPAARLRIISIIAEAAGPVGMVGGQVLDMEGEGRTLTREELEGIHRRKTGALLTASVLVGGVAAGCTDMEYRALERYGAAIGLAFQVADDILDLTATTEELGKTAGSDLERHKATYPAIMGLDASRRYAEQLVAEAVEAIAGLPEAAWTLRELAAYIIARKN